MHDHHNRPQAPSGGIGEATARARSGLRHERPSRQRQAPRRIPAVTPIISVARGAKPNSSRTLRPISARSQNLRHPVPEGAIYTCPMHPEIRQTGPGNCPICGMALEPEVASADAGPNPELADMTRRFWIALALSLPVVVLEMGGHLFNLHMLISQMTSNWVQFVLATPVVLWAGWPFFERGAKSLVTRNLNMFTLIAMGTGVAWAYSVVATLAPGLFPQAFRGADGSVAIYFEAAAVITVLVLLGQVLELRAREQTSNAIKALLGLAPKTARRLRGDNTDEEVPLDAIAVGDRLRVRPGEKVPVDGAILEGRATIDESLVTGESMPVGKDAGAKVIAGTLNQTGVLCHARGKGRQRHASRPDRELGGQGATKPGANPASRRSGRRLVRALGDRHGPCRLRRLGDPWPGAAFRLWARRRRLGLDYRLPLRARPRDADVDHGRGRTRRASGRAHQERRGAGTHGKDRHARRRQDRHPHRGQAEGRGDPDPCGPWRGRILAARREPRARERTSARGGDRRARQRSASSNCPSRPASTLPSEKGLWARSRAASVAIGNAGFLDASGIGTAELAKEADALRKDGATVDLHGAGRQGRRAPRHRRSGQSDGADASRRCKAKACAW